MIKYLSLFLLFISSLLSDDFTTILRSSIKTRSDYSTVFQAMISDRALRVTLKNTNGDIIGDYGLRMSGQRISEYQSDPSVGTESVDVSSLPLGEPSEQNSQSSGTVNSVVFQDHWGDSVSYEFEYFSGPNQQTSSSTSDIWQDLQNAFGGQGYISQATGNVWVNYGSRLYRIFNIQGEPGDWSYMTVDYYQGNARGAVYTPDYIGPISDSLSREKALSAMNDTDFNVNVEDPAGDTDFEIEIDTSTFEGDGYMTNDGDFIDVPDSDVEKNENDGKVNPNSEEKGWMIETETGTQKSDAETALLQDILNKLKDIEEGLYSSSTAGSTTGTEPMPGTNEYGFVAPHDYSEDLESKTFVEIFQAHYEQWQELPVFDLFTMPELSLGGNLPSYSLNADLGITSFNGSLDFEQYRQWFELLGLFFYFVCCWRAFEIIF